MPLYGSKESLRLILLLSPFGREFPELAEEERGLESFFEFDVIKIFIPKLYIMSTLPIPIETIKIRVLTLKLYLKYSDFTNYSILVKSAPITPGLIAKISSL